ncbi:hypothetical protein HDU76_007320 [Blyttiomyces sp. JEL0837]|nr:hypothetical protein HDU76_007320 [Blyttiomyces sp. JEL0837]
MAHPPNVNETQVSLDQMIASILDRAVYHEANSTTTTETVIINEAVKLQEHAYDHVSNIPSANEASSNDEQTILSTVLLTDTNTLRQSETIEMQVLQAVGEHIISEGTNNMEEQSEIMEEYDSDSSDKSMETESNNSQGNDDTYPETNDDMDIDDTDDYTFHDDTNPISTNTIDHPITTTHVDLSAGLTMINEFKNPADLFRSLFPLEFLLGQGLCNVDNDIDGGVAIPADLETHLLEQHDYRFLNNGTFISLQFNQKQRHAALQCVSVRAKSNHGSFRAFDKIINRPTIQAELQAAKNNPKSQKAKKLIRELSKVVKIVGATVPYSKASRTSILSKIMNLMRYNSTPVFYFTITFAVMDAPPFLKMLFRGHAPYEWTIPDYNDRMKIVLANPGLMAAHIKRMFENIHTHILKMEPSSKTRRSVPVESRPMGATGRLLNYVAVMEHAGSLDAPHFHYIAFSQINGDILEQAIGNTQLEEACAEWLNSIFISKLDPETHAYIRNNPRYRDDLTRTGLQESPYRSVNPQGHHERIQNQMLLTNIHAHAPTCHTSPAGKTHCRMALPGPENSYGTRPVWFRYFENGDVTEIPIASLDYYKQQLQQRINELSELTQNKQVILWEPEPADKPRGHFQILKVWDLELSKQDGLVVPTLKLFALALGSNTNCQLLGNTTSAFNTAAYVSQYMAKDGGKLNQTVPALLEAITTIERFPSQALDSGTRQRTTTHHLERC